MASSIHVLGISGSLRKGSYNTALLRAAGELMPEGMDLEIFDLSPIPLYNEDIHAQGFPEPVQRFREDVRAADALLFATPEYNFSIPGVLKNALDWASRPPAQPFNGKPAAIMGASTGLFGTVRAQEALRRVFVFMNIHALNVPQVLVAQASQKFDAQGHLTDPDTRHFIQDLMTNLADWTRTLRGEKEG